MPIYARLVMGKTSFVGTRVSLLKRCLFCLEDVNGHKIAVIQNIIYTFFGMFIRFKPLSAKFKHFKLIFIEKACPRL